MAAKIILKKSSVAGKAPQSTDLEVGELAVNLEDQQLYSKKADGTIISFGGGTSSGVPSGTIVMWSGSFSTIPAGWAVCDGSNGTPNLRDRFIVGAGAAYSHGETGGSSQVTLTVDQIPSHSHSIQGYIRDNYDVNDIFSNVWGLDPGAGEYGTSSVGGGQPHENRPPYYALYFIMKL